MDPISSLGNTPVPDYGSILNDMSGNPVGFGNLFDQAMSQASTPQQKAQTAFLQVEYDNMNTLYGAVSGNSDPLMGSVSDMMGLEMGSLSSQLSQLETLLGLPTSGSGSNSALNTQSLSSDQMMGLEAQQLLNNDLASFGTDSSSGINTLI